MALYSSSFGFSNCTKISNIDISSMGSSLQICLRFSFIYPDDSWKSCGCFYRSYLTGILWKPQNGYGETGEAGVIGLSYCLSIHVHIPYDLRQATAHVVCVFTCCTVNREGLPSRDGPFYSMNKLLPKKRMSHISR